MHSIELVSRGKVNTEMIEYEITRVEKNIAVVRWEILSTENRSKGKITVPFALVTEL